MRVARIPLVLFVGLAIGSAGMAADPAARVRERVQALLAKESVPDEQIGLVVADAATGARWFSHQGDLPLKPASVLKLFTTAAALHKFGPDVAFETRLYLVGSELWVIGGGDPGLGDDRILDRHGRNLRELVGGWARRVAELAPNRPISTIVIDDTIFDEQLRHPDWPTDQDEQWYQAPVGGINFNDNCLDAWAEARNGDVTIHMTPALPGALYANELTAAAKHKPLCRRAYGSDVFVFSGPIGKTQYFGSVTAGRPAVFFGYALRQALQDGGVDVTGQVVRRKLRQIDRRTAQLVAVERTPLTDILWRCNTHSQNLFAECLLKALAAYTADGTLSETPGSWTGGVAEGRRLLAEIGVATDRMVWRDGSGLSHENRVTADQVVDLLVKMRGHRYGTTYAASLAAAGEEGTLKRRYSDPKWNGRLRAKTGTIQGVRTLAGYLDREDGTTLAFAVLCNGPNGRNTLRELCAVLAKD